MPASKPNGLSGGAPRRRGRGRAANDGTTPLPASVEWVARLDALALALAELPERTAVIERAVREVMELLPADSVTVRPEVPADADAGRATIPIEVGGRRFGALELAMKPERVPDAAERTLLLAIGRQCALALARLEASAERPLDPAAVGAALDGVTAGVRALVSVARSAALPSPHRIAEAERMAITHLDDLRRRVGA